MHQAFDFILIDMLCDLRFLWEKLTEWLIVYTCGVWRIFIQGNPTFSLVKRLSDSINCALELSDSLYFTTVWLKPSFFSIGVEDFFFQLYRSNNILLPWISFIFRNLVIDTIQRCLNIIAFYLSVYPKNPFDGHFYSDD